LWISELLGVGDGTHILSRLTKSAQCSQPQTDSFQPQSGTDDEHIGSVIFYYSG